MLHERVLALVNEHKCAGDRTAFGYHAEHPVFFRNPSSISLLTQWTTTELIPVSACFRRVVRISPEVISLRPFSTTAWYTGTVVMGSVVTEHISSRIASMSPPIERSLIVSAPNSSAIRAFLISSPTFTFPVEVPRLTLILVLRPLPIPTSRSPRCMITVLPSAICRAEGRGIHTFLLCNQPHLWGNYPCSCMLNQCFHRALVPEYPVSCGGSKDMDSDFYVRTGSSNSTIWIQPELTKNTCHESINNWLCRRPSFSEVNN